MTIIFGASDDLIEIEGDVYDEVPVNDDKPVSFSASDGTSGSITYGKGGMWEIAVKKEGDKLLYWEKNKGEDGDHDKLEIAGLVSAYSDAVVLKDGIEWVKIGRKTFKAKS